MTAAVLQNPIFTDETAAREWLEARVWASGVSCPHCGNADAAKITKLEGTKHRPGLYQCNEPRCREQFTVTVGTVFERSKIPLTKWLAALFLMTASKKGVSAHQVHRMLKVSYKSTWFMMHRLREAMRIGDFAIPQMGGGDVSQFLKGLRSNVPGLRWCKRYPRRSSRKVIRHSLHNSLIDLPSGDPEESIGRASTA